MPGELFPYSGLIRLVAVVFGGPAGEHEVSCASAAASCSSGAASPSHVLAAMGVAPERARGSLRLSMGAETTEDDVDAVIAILSGVVFKLRSGL